MKKMEYLKIGLMIIKFYKNEEIEFNFKNWLK